MKVVIIGLGTAGFAAQLAIRKFNKNAKLTILDKKKFHLQHSCGLPYAIDNTIKVENLEHKIDTKVESESEVTSINTADKEVTYTQKGKTKTVNYDKLLLDLGSIPFIPPIEGLDNALVVHNTDDVRKIANVKGKKALVIGAGAIGLETAYALKENGYKVTVVEALPTLLPKAIDPDMSSVLENQLDLSLLLNHKVEKVENNKVTVSGQHLEADLVISATGVRPNMELAEKAGLKVSKNGIVVNASLQTSDENIYAAGDCVEMTNQINGIKFPGQLATTAYKQGTLAGENIAGKDSKYKGTISTFVSVIGDIEVASTGLNSEQAGDIIIGKSHSTDKPEWYDDKDKLTVKIIADKQGKILGAQAIGKNAYMRINVVSTAIAAGMTLQQLSDVELAYCPAVSQTYDVLQQAVDFALRRLK